MSGLADARSPFLRHGAEQPVDWWPWGAAAFQRAREQDRPVLLDIGAVWCHWCHVMDRESYEDPETAALINEHFVPVKVDRDERPDVDARYQRAVQSLVGQGGWPLTAFLTPEGDVFHGGTYFPPTDAHGRPSFRRVLTEIARVWREERGRVDAAAGAVRERLDQVLAVEAAPGSLDRSALDAVIDALSTAYDARHGGFGGAPKFPAAGALALLLDRWLDAATDPAGPGPDPAGPPGPAGPGERARAMLAGTLDAMADGGFHDQLGGGFHRYSTDARWIIPHFEKMAYDNGPLLQLYARAAAAAGSPAWRAVAEGVVAHYRDVAPDLVDAGGFPASQDADIGFRDDGDYWTWTAAELRAAAGDAEGTEGTDGTEAAILHWGIGDPASAMHLDPDRHVLYRAVPPGDVARRLDRDPATVRAQLAAARRALKAARDRRPAPFVDRTVYSGWTALVAAGHIAAARHLGLADAGAAGLRALERVWAEAWRPGRGLLHRVGDPDSGLHLGDQAHAADAFLDAFEWTQDERWIERARSTLAVIRERFGHPSGGLTDRPTDAEVEVDVLGRERLEITDAPEPSPTAVAALALARLAALDHDDDARDAARSILTTYAGSAPRFGAVAGTFARAVRWALGPVTTVVVVEAPGGSLLAAALETYRPATVVRRLDPGAVDTARLPAALAAMVTGDAPRAYVCAGSVCAAPVADPDELRTLLRTFRG